MQEETELARVETILVRGLTNSKMGTAVLTNGRILFWDEKFANTGQEGILEDAVLGWLRQRHAAKGPMLDIPLGSILRLSMQKKFMARDRIAIATSDGDFLLNEGWMRLSPILRDALVNNGRRVVEEMPESWRVEPA